MNEYNKQINKIKRKRNRILYIKYIVGFLCLGICLGLVLFKAKSKFSYQDEEELINTTVATFTYEPIKKIAFINNEYVSGGFPSKDDTLVLDNVSCTNNAQATFDITSWELTITNGVAKTKCSVYFTK